MIKVFLGGTCNGSRWREELIKDLIIEYFHPIVEKWTLESQREELLQREICDYNLYTITKEIEGYFSIAEAVDDSNKRPLKTIFCVIENGFNEHQKQSLIAVAQIIKENGGRIFYSLTDVASFLNSRG